MSPSESQLRAALRAGEGGGVDVDAVIGRAHKVRRDRRRRITAAAGVSVAVVLVGVGTAVIGASSDHGAGGHPSAGHGLAGAGTSVRAGGNAPVHPATPAAQLPVSTQVPASTQLPVSGAELGCPKSPERYMLPGGGGLGRFGSTAPLFARKVSVIRVCAYPVHGAVQGRATGTVVSGSAAQELAARIDARPATSGGGVSRCAGGTTALVELLGEDVRGRALPAVVLTVSCTRGQATNGTAVRYLTTLPAVVTNLLRH